MPENMDINDPQQLNEFLQKLLDWHGERVESLQLILDHKDARLKIGDKEIEPDSDIAKGIRFGVGIALDTLGKLPFSVDEVEEE
jgi:hypothetical protein